MEFGNKEDLAKELIRHQRDLEHESVDWCLHLMWNGKETVRVTKDHLSWQSLQVLHAKVKNYGLSPDLFPCTLR